MIAIVDYKAGNLTSVARAVEHLGYTATITDKPEDIAKADRVIFPGVGAAGSTMESLSAKGLDNALKQAFGSGKPFLGICIGCQVILSYSRENDTPCLGLVKGRVEAFSPSLKEAGGNTIKIPHMGWNGIRVTKPHPVLEGVTEKDEFYFVHSYYPVPEHPENSLAETDYGVMFTSVIGEKNLVATQFHLEKSGKSGLGVLSNFLRWNPLSRSAA